MRKTLIAFVKSIKNSRVLRLLSQYKREVLVLFLFNLFSVGFFLVAPYFSKLYIDDAFLNKDFAKFLQLSLLGVIIFVVTTLVRIIGDIASNRISIRLKFNLANTFIAKFYALDLDFFQSASAGENAYRLADIGQVANFILVQVPSLLVDILKLPIILAICLWLNFRMTVFLLILSPLFLIQRLYIQKRLRPIYEEMWKYGANLSRLIYEAFSRITIIKAFGLESFQRHAYLRQLIKNIRLELKGFRLGIISSLASSFLSKVVYGAITLYGGWLIIKGRTSLGSYTAVMIYIMQLGGLLESFSYRFEHFVKEIISLNRFFEIMGAQPRVRDAVGSRPLKSMRGEIRFEEASFGYQEDKFIFRGLNLVIPAFSWVGIVGPSGCGKTTLTKLILRLYDPWQGRILLDSLDLRNVALKSLREKIAIATQQPLLFNVSIGENISYGLRGVRQEDIEEAAKTACIHDYIEQLPRGYSTLIGEDACRLSEGQKQRLALARAILRRPELLILDEATSSVDSATEERIFQNLREARQGLSTIIVSHRLFSVKEAERIYFFRPDGKIEEGAHEQLFSSSESYREFFHNQIEEEVVR